MHLGCRTRIEDLDDPEKTPPIAPAMQCVINLTAQFFFVYLLPLNRFLRALLFQILIAGFCLYNGAIRVDMTPLEYRCIVASDR